MEIELEINMALNPFNSNILANELNDYILDCCEFLPQKKDVLNIVVKGLAHKEQDKFANVLHIYYQNKLCEYKKIFDMEQSIRFVFFIIGVLAILISELFSSFLEELFLIAAWVIVWEIIYDLLFKQIKRIKKAKIYKYLANAKISFKD